MRPLLGVVAMSVAMACSVGTRVEQFQPAREPAGVTMRLRLQVGRGNQVVTGELLAVQDSGLLVRDSTRILFVPNGSVRRGETIAHGGGATFAGKPTGSTRERLRLLSRYPGGVPADLLGSLLAAYGRDSVESVH